MHENILAEIGRWTAKGWLNGLSHFSLKIVLVQINAHHDYHTEKFAEYVGTLKTVKTLYLFLTFFEANEICLLLLTEPSIIC